MTIAIAAASAVIGGTERTVSEWCVRHGRSKSMMDLLCHNGCRSFREAENHTAIDLAILAGRALLHRHDWVANAADRILHVHSLLTSIAPPPAASAQLISTALGLGNRDAVTLYQANCASFLAALRVARSIIRARSALRGILIVGSDRQYSDSQRAMGVAAMTSDAGVAVLVTRSGAPADVLAIEVRTDGRFPRGVMFDEEHDHDDRYNALTRRSITRALKKARLELSMVRHIFPHNVNLRGWLRNLSAVGLGPDQLHMQGFASIGHGFVCDPVLNLILGYPENPDGRIALLHSNGASGWAGTAVLRLNAPLPHVMVDLSGANKRGSSTENHHAKAP